LSSARFEQSDFGYIGLKDTRRVNSKVCEVIFAVRLRGKTSLTTIKKVIEDNNNVHNDFKVGGDLSAATITVQVKVTGKPNSIPFARKVALDVIASIKAKHPQPTLNQRGYKSARTPAQRGRLATRR